MTQQDRHYTHLADLTLITAPYYPYLTAAGILHTAPVTDYNADQSCRRCRYLAECHRRVCAGGYAMCEKIIASELLPEAIIKQMEVAHV